MRSSDVVSRYFDELRRRAPLDVVAQRLGMTLQRRGSRLVASCPSPSHRDSTPSWSADIGRGAWYCHGCKVGGDVVHLVEFAQTGSVRNGAEADARDWIAREVAGMPALAEQLRPLSQEQREQIERQRQERAELAQVYRLMTGLFHRALKQHNELLDALGRRYGLTVDTIDHFRVGWAPDHVGPLLGELQQRGVPRETLLATGLWSPTHDGLRAWFRNRLVFPVWDGSGQVSTLIARRVDAAFELPDEWLTPPLRPGDEPPKHLRPLGPADKRPWVSSLVGGGELFVAQQPRQAELPDAATLIIVEGITDALAAWQAGSASVAVLTTALANNCLPQALAHARRADRVVVVSDADAPGRAGALATAEAIEAAGVTTRLVTLDGDDGRDLTDVLRDAGLAAAAATLRELVTVSDETLPMAHRILAIDPATTAAEFVELMPELADHLSWRPRPMLEAVYFPLLKQHLGKELITSVMLRELQRLIKSRRSVHDPTGAAGDPDRGPQRKRKYRIQANHVQLTDVVNETWEAILAANRPPTVFQKSGVLVRLKRAEDQARAFSPPQIVALNQRAVFGLMARVATWYHMEADGFHDSSPSVDASYDLIENPRRELPPLESVEMVPVFGAGGELVSRSGYHPSEQMWLENQLEHQLASVPSAPTADQVDQARGLLVDELLGEFPFVHQADRCHALALLLLPFCRRLIAGVTPLHLVEAPTPGSGKSLLANLLSVMATGYVANARTLPKSEDDMRKGITAELLTGRPLVLFDNADTTRGPLDSPAIAAVLTTGWWTDRVLGRSEITTLPNRAVWLLTGNNVSLSMELARRSVRIRIDPGVDRPWQRAGFRHPHLIGWATEHRAELVHAALTLVANWIARGSRPGNQSLGSFEAWAGVMGGICSAAGVPGFLGNLDQLYEAADAEGAMWRLFISAWWEVHGSKPVSTGDLAELCRDNDLMPSVLGDGNERSQSTRLGKALGKAIDRVFMTYKIELRRDKKEKRNFYGLVEIDDGAEDSLPEFLHDGESEVPF